MKTMHCLVVLLMLTLIADVNGFILSRRGSRRPFNRPHFASHYLEIMDGDRDGFVELYDIADLFSLRLTNPVLVSAFKDADENGDRLLEENELKVFLDFDAIHSFIKQAEVADGGR